MRLTGILIALLCACLCMLAPLFDVIGEKIIKSINWLFGKDEE